MIQFMTCDENDENDVDAQEEEASFSSFRKPLVVKRSKTNLLFFLPFFSFFEKGPKSFSFLAALIKTRTKRSMGF